MHGMLSFADFIQYFLSFAEGALSAFAWFSQFKWDGYGK